MSDWVHRSCWCGADNAIMIGAFALDDGARFPLVRCAGCGVQALHPQPDEATLRAAYSQGYYGGTRRKFITPMAMMIEVFQAHRARVAARLTPTGGRVLDIGCGNGEFLLRMKRLGFHVEGTEWTAASAARIPENAGIQVHIGDLLALNLPPRTFDFISIWHVLEHVRQPLETLQLIERLLTPTGKLLIAVPNADSRQARRFGLSWLHHDPPRHLFGFGPDSLRQLLHRAGFNIQWQSTRSMEQNTFGHMQSWLNAHGRPRDRLYTALKSGEQTHEAGVRSDVFWMLALSVPALLVSSIEAALGTGATLVVCATKNRTSNVTVTD